MTLFNSVSSLLARVCVLLACVIAVAMAVLISAEVVLRSFFSTTMYFTDEFSGYMVLAIFALGSGYAMDRNMLLSVEMVYHRASRRVQAVMARIFGVLSLIFCLLVDWQMWRLMAKSLNSGIHANTLTATPLWMPQAIIVLGMIVLTLVVLKKTITPDLPADALADAILQRD